MTDRPEAWLRGPGPGISPWLQPAAHALIQAGEDAERAVEGLTTEELWYRPGDAATPGCHLRPIPGAISRPLTYARGAQLSAAPRRPPRAQGEPRAQPAKIESLTARTG